MTPSTQGRTKAKPSDDDRDTIAMAQRRVVRAAPSTPTPNRRHRDITSLLNIIGVFALGALVGGCALWAYYFAR